MTHHFMFSNSPNKNIIAFMQGIKYVTGPWKTF